MGNERRKGPREMVSGGEFIYGRRPVMEVLRAGRRRIAEVLLPPADKYESDEIALISQCAHSMGIAVRHEDRKRLDMLTRGGHHQGVAAKVSPYPYASLSEIASDVQANDNATVVVLDHLEDPQNIGSILRSACAAGVTGVIIPEDRSSGVTPAAVRASAGAAEHMKVARVVNVVRAMGQLKDAGMWFTGLDWGDDAKPYTSIDFRGRSGLVVGAEGAGISRLVRESCDFIAVLPMLGEVESLNAGVATGICLYEMLRQRA